jgi:predicted PurR-regulated permease PerM
MFRILGIIVLAGIILKTGSPLFVPLSFALFVSFILQPFCTMLERRGSGRVLAIIVGLLLISAIIGVLLYVLYLQFKNFTAEWGVIRIKLGALLLDIKEFFTVSLGFPRDQVEDWFQGMISSTANNTVKMIETTIISVFVNVVMLVLIPIYAFLILYYRSQLVSVLYSLFPEPQRIKVADVVRLAIETYYRFIKGMAVVYLTVGVLNSAGLYFLGVPHPFLFGFLTAIMTFIPYIGIIVASLLPITYAWITYGSFWYPLGVIAIFTFVQYVEANIIFPWAVSQKLELNTLITLMVIVAGGIIWGAAGMILFVPFAAILKLIADRMEGWESLSKLLGK